MLNVLLFFKESHRDPMLVKAEKLSVMKKINGVPVMVVEFKECFSAPKFGQYEHPAIIRTIPCVRRGRQLFDLRNGSAVRPEKP